MAAICLYQYLLLVCVFVLCENVLVCWLGILLMGDVVCFFSPDKAQ